MSKIGMQSDPCERQSGKRQGSENSKHFKDRDCQCPLAFFASLRWFVLLTYRFKVFKRKRRSERFVPNLGQAKSYQAIDHWHFGYCQRSSSCFAQSIMPIVGTCREFSRTSAWRSIPSFLKPVMWAHPNLEQSAHRFPLIFSSRIPGCHTSGKKTARPLPRQPSHRRSGIVHFIFTDANCCLCALRSCSSFPCVADACEKLHSKARRTQPHSHPRTN